MQIITNISSLKLATGENPIVLPNREWFRAMTRKAGKTDWDMVISNIDKHISRAGAIVITLSILYFTPILVSMLLR